MPGNEISENIHNFFDQDNSSQSYQSQVASGSWPVLNNNPWIGTQRPNGVPLAFNSVNYVSQPSDSELGNGRQSLETPAGTNLTQLSVKPEVFRSLPRNQQLNLNGYIHGSQVLQGKSNQGEFQGGDTVANNHNLMRSGFAAFASQQGNTPGSRPEVTEAAISFDFLGRQQQFMRNQHPGISQPRPRQQQGFNDVQLWQQHLMYKQLQEIQRQQQLQQLDQGGRQQNSHSQLSGITGQVAPDQVPALLSGMPIADASNWDHELLKGEPKLPNSSHLFLGLAQRSGPSIQGVPNGLMFDQGQLMRSMGIVPQQPEQSLYGTPVASTRGFLNNYSQFQGASHDLTSHEAMAKAGGNHSAKSLTHPSAFSYIQSDHSVVSEPGYMHDGISVASQGIQGRSVPESVPMHGVSSGATSGNFQQVNHLPHNVQVQELQDHQEQADWSGKLQEKAVGLVGSSHAVASLDPTEEKLLFGSEDDGNHDTSTGGYLHANPMQSDDCFSGFPSMQSGSWSALMQEAVEASSSDTGLHEEWSGLSFQKIELPSGNRSVVLNDNGKQQATWDDSIRQAVSSSASRPFPLFNDTGISSDCRAAPVLQQPTKFAYEQNERVAAGASHGSFLQLSEEANQPFDQSQQQKQYVGGNLQTGTQFNNASNGVWAGRMYEQPAGSAQSDSANLDSRSQNLQHAWAQQPKMPLHSALGQPNDKLNGWNTQSLASSGDYTPKPYHNGDTMQNAQRNDMKRTMDMEKGHDGSMWKAGGNPMAMSFPNSSGAPESPRCNVGSPMRHSEDPGMGDLDSPINSNSLRLEQEMNQQILNRQQVNYGKGPAVDSFMKNRGDYNVTKYRNQLSGSPQAWNSSMNNTDKRLSEIWNHKQENSFPAEVSKEGSLSNDSHHGQNSDNRIAKENSLLTGSDPHPLVNSNQKSSSQSGRKNVGPRKFQCHPMGNIEMNRESVNSPNYMAYSQGPPQPVVHGLQHQEGNVGNSRFASHHVSNTVTDMGQGHLTDLQRNERIAEEAGSGGPFPRHASGIPSFDGSTIHFPQNKRTGLTSENMLELLQKVDQSSDRNTDGHFSSSDLNTPSEVPEATASDGSASSALQGFGLKLAPPSQRQSMKDHSQTSLQTVEDSDQRNLDSGAREQEHTWSSPVTSVQPPAYEASQRENLDKRSQIQGSLPAVSAFLMNQAILQNRQQQLQHRQQQLPQQQQQQQQKQQKQQQHFSFASGTLQNDQSAKVSSGVQLDVQVKHSSHHRQIQEFHDGAIADQSSHASLGSVAGQILPSRLTPVDTCGSAASQVYPVNKGHSQPISASTHIRSSGQQLPPLESRSAIQPCTTSSVSQQGGFSTMLHNVWTSVSNQRRLSGVQPQKIISNVLQSMSPLPSTRSTNSQSPQKADDQSKTGGNPSVLSACSINPQQVAFGEEHVKDSTSQEMASDRVDASPGTGSVPTEQEPEQKHNSDGNNLDPSGAQKHNYSLLQQMQAMKGADFDPSKRAGKRLKGESFGTDTAQADWAAGQRFIYGQNTVFREVGATSPQNSFPSDIKMLSFSSRESEERSVNVSLQVIGTQQPPQNLLTSVQRGLQNQVHSFGKSSPLTFIGGSERPQISPQMAPSWFERYGSYKNGQLLTTYDGLSSSQRNTKAAAQHYFPSKETIDDNNVEDQRDEASRFSSLRQSMPPTVMPANHYLSLQCLPPEVVDNNITLMPKKRKTTASDLLPWHKEVTQGAQRLQSISMAETEWSQATNRLVEKVEDDFDMIEDGLLMNRPRTRLILTTQLMQQILASVPAAFLAADATTSYENVIYFISKLTLRDACSLACCKGSDSRIHLDSGNMMSEEHNTSEKTGDNIFSKVMENFIGRSRKLENDFLRLDRRASILDVRLECQDLERCSIMNRFAKFHGRGQTDGVESTSTSETAATRRTFPQRHVTAFTIPRNLPEGVLCLSL